MYWRIFIFPGDHSMNEWNFHQTEEVIPSLTVYKCYTANVNCSEASAFWNNMCFLTITDPNLYNIHTFTELIQYFANSYKLFTGHAK